MIDVLVIGGGPAGSAAGYWLASHGHSVTIVEKRRFPRKKTCGDALDRGQFASSQTWASVWWWSNSIGSTACASVLMGASENSTGRRIPTTPVAERSYVGEILTR